MEQLRELAQQALEYVAYVSTYVFVSLEKFHDLFLLFKLHSLQLEVLFHKMYLTFYIFLCHAHFKNQITYRKTKIYVGCIVVATFFYNLPISAIEA